MRGKWLRLISVMLACLLIITPEVSVVRAAALDAKSPNAVAPPATPTALLRSALMADGASERDVEMLVSQLDATLRTATVIPATQWYYVIGDYRLMIRYETHHIRCVQGPAPHLNVHLRNIRLQQNVFNIHIGGGYGPSGRIRVFLFNSVGSFDVCEEIPSWQDVRNWVEAKVRQFLAAEGIELPSWVVTSIVYFIILILLLIPGPQPISEPPVTGHVVDRNRQEHPLGMVAVG